MILSICEIDEQECFATMHHMKDAFERPTNTEPESHPEITFAHMEGLQAEAAFDAALFAHGERIEEGVQGVIVRTELSALDAQLREVFADVVEDDAPAAKILKIYSPGAAPDELAHQHAAYRLLENLPDQTGYARIPKTFAAYDLAFHEQLKEHLESMGMSITSDHVEILMMEYIPGKDLETLLLQEVLRRHPESHVAASTAAQLDHHMLYSQVAALLQLEVTTSPHAGDQNVRSLLQARGRNTERIIAFLKKSGFVMRADVLPQIERTLRHLHANGMHHRDMHARNVMVVGSLEQEDSPAQTYLIDFSFAKRGVNKNSDPYVDEDSAGQVLYADDLSIIKQLSPLTETVAESRSKETLLRSKELSQLEQRIMKSNGKEKEFLDLLTANEAGLDVFRDAARRGLRASVSELDMKVLFIGATALLRSGRINPTQLGEILTQDMSHLPQAKQNQISQFLADIRSNYPSSLQ